MRLLSRFMLMILLSWAGLSAFAQSNPPPVEGASNAPPVSRDVEVLSLEALLKSIQSKEQEVDNVKKQLAQAADEVSRKELLAQLVDLNREADELNRQFIEFSAQEDIRPFINEKKKDFDWQEKLGELLKPIVTEFENATAESRAIGELRSGLNEAQKKHAIAKSAVKNLEGIQAKELSADLQNRINKELDLWTRRRDEAGNEATALDLQLQNRLNAKKSFLDSTTGYVENFFRTRGFNLFMGVAAFFLVFFGLRLLRLTGRKLRRSKNNRSFGSRLGNLLLEISGVVGGLLAALMVFNMVGDWFLLGIIFIFLLGVGWASINTLPRHIETVKLILNIGAVREGQRIVFDKIPWKVTSLGIQAKLSNPLLEGGLQRLPVKFLVGMHSRSPGEDEAWFPCKKGDWVELSDERIGKVTYQSPSSVQLSELGGSLVTYQTSEFLELNPRNMSTNFRIKSRFGIDYQHQAISTTEVPQKLKAQLETGLARVVQEEHLLGLAVNFATAGASSLDYEIDVDLDGEAAEHYLKIGRAIQRICVEACNEHGWEIPFTQITLHQKPAPGS